MGCPKYTVIMPAYNARKTIRKSLLSVLRQDGFSDSEIIVVDDGSIDGTASEVKKIAKDYIGKIILVQQKNMGPGKARNVGIAKARGEYIAFLDSDDYYDSRFFDEINKKIEAESPDLVFIETKKEYRNGKTSKISNIGKHRKKSKSELMGLQISGIIPWGPCLKIVKSEIIKKCNFSSIDVGEEAIYSYDVLKESCKISFVTGIALYHYVYNVSGQHKKGGIDPWGGVVAAIDERIRRDGKYNKFKKEINSLAVRAKIISAYRISNSKRRACELTPVIEDIKRLYKICNKKHLDASSRIIGLMASMGLRRLIIFVSRIRSARKGCNG